MTWSDAVPTITQPTTKWGSENISSLGVSTTAKINVTTVKTYAVALNHRWALNHLSLENKLLRNVDATPKGIKKAHAMIAMIP
mmetsp:Transcript_24016/g.34432  ORF Transcript_24016/g.34432 Transcript_24016/m.34432 type:complete len:83 (-) Transcript_24016:767-1015(-)